MFSISLFDIKDMFMIAFWYSRLGHQAALCFAVIVKVCMLAEASFDAKLYLLWDLARLNIAGVLLLQDFTMLLLWKIIAILGGLLA